MNSNQIIIFASGSGSNAENLINYFYKKRSNYRWLICTNNPKAGVIERAKNLQIDCKIFKKNELYNWEILNYINSLRPELIILAGFLLKFPHEIITIYNQKIINIHPALLPKYGGKGMYGKNVHKAIIKNQEKVSGITIHYVNNEYDKGPIIFQKQIKINSSFTPNELANKIHDLEMEYFPKIVENILTL